MAKICLVHLIRNRNGIEAFKEFFKSYKKHPAGLSHELVLIFKGFPGKDIGLYEELLEGISYKPFFVADFGFDIRPYFLAVNAFDHDFFVFLNSFSVIRCDSWLEKMYKYAQSRDVGAVGVSSSMESMYDSALKYRKKIGLIKKLLFRKTFEKFPNYHLRTNGIMSSREILVNISVPLILTKFDAHRFESGINSFTKQIQRMGKKVLVVGCDGMAYEKDEWFRSRTFRLGDQENLMIDDNQAVAYRNASPSEKKILSEMSWGSHLRDS